MLETALRCLPSTMLLGLSCLLLLGTLNQGRRAQRTPRDSQRPARTRRTFVAANSGNLASVPRVNDSSGVHGKAGDLPLRRVA